MNQKSNMEKSGKEQLERSSFAQKSNLNNENKRVFKFAKKVELKEEKANNSNKIQ